MLFPKIFNHVLIFHPGRQEGSEQVWYSSEEYVVLLVDGLDQESLAPEILDFIMTTPLKRVSVHARLGVYQGQPFDNTHMPETVMYSHTHNQCVMAGTYPPMSSLVK